MRGDHYTIEQKREACLAFQRTDDRWGKLLRERFGGDAGDMRYRPVGKGAKGTPIRIAHDARDEARRTWERAFGLDE